jgi:hypothetical protein
MESVQRIAEVDLVDQPGGEVLANGGNATAESDILILARVRQSLQRSEPATNPATNEGQPIDKAVRRCTTEPRMRARAGRRGS